MTNNEHIQRFQADHPELTILDTASDEGKLLKWAYDKRYIRLISFADKFWYSKMDLADAKMWKEKDPS